MTGLSEEDEKWTGACGSFPQTAIGNVGDPFGRFIKVGVVLLDEAGEGDRARAAMLTETLQGCEQDRCQIFG
ncbi:MAG: hypothetical protein J0H81_00670 [Sphingopyxis terrae]|nr:hypothetical protein [Sphingopyxis terrae]